MIIMTTSNIPKTDDLIHKLENSTAMQSLAMEKHVASRLQKLKWDVVHSCYYTDTKENKPREIDVTGKQVWVRHMKGYLDDVLRLHVIIECKSAKGFHLLFASTAGDNYIGKPHDQWFGQESDIHRLRLADTLTSSGLNKAQMSTVIGHYNRIAYQDEEVSPEQLYVGLLPPLLQASAFRETNFGVDKELETSVLWKAGLALSSAISSFKEDYILGCLDDIKLGVDMALLNSEDEDSVVQEIIDELNSRAGQLDLYHPIVVVDCMLWDVTGAEPKRVEWCRLKQSDIHHLGEWWFDVVSYDCFDRYITELTNHYKKQLVELKAHLD
jgi:hypothetical protein